MPGHISRLHLILRRSAALNTVSLVPERFSLKNLRDPEMTQIFSCRCIHAIMETDHHKEGLPVSGQTVSSSSNDFEACMERVASNKERVRIMRHGQEIVAIIPIEDLDLLEELEDRLDVLEALEAIEEAKAYGGVISWEQFVADLEG